MKKNKITAAVMAMAMAVSMAATTAMSASATSVGETNSPVAIEETDRAMSISTTGKAVIWNPTSDGTVALNYFVGKYSNPTNQSMAAGAVSGATLTKSGSTYTLNLTTQSMTYSFLGISYSASIKTAKIVLQDGTQINGVKNGNTISFTFSASDLHKWVGTAYANGYQNSTEIDFTTTMEDEAIFSLLPSSMKNPQTFFLFTT